MANRTFANSGKGNPCPICARSKDGDCRISDDLILCRIGGSFSPPTEKAGTQVTGKDGGQWICRGPASDPSWIQFALAGRGTHSNNNHPHHRPNPFRIEAPAAMAAIAGSIDLARLPGPLPAAPPAHLPNDYRLDYSPAQRVTVKRTPDGGKGFPVQHLASNGDTAVWAKGAGPDPWPLWRQAEALQHGRGHWVTEAEGEKCADWLRAGGLLAISQPGHAHKPEQIQPRYLTLKQAGISGIIYLADNDAEGRRRAALSQQAAAAVGLPLLALSAGDAWPGVPGLGSIDDAPGTPAERVAAIEQAIPDAIAQHQDSLAQQQGDKPSRLTKAELQAFLQDAYRLEFNELTRDCEIDGTPMGSRLHLADSFLAQQHGLEVSKQAAADSFEFVAKSNPYNPVRRYLLGLRERTGLRLISMEDLGRAFAILPTDSLSQYMLAAHLSGAVLRGLNPGHKHHQIVAFTGAQGNGKSSSIQALSPPGWCDSATKVSDLESKDVLAKINSAWIFEFDECEHTLQRSTAAEFKGFITRERDVYVEKYEKQATPHERRGILFGTSNQSEFLNDSTGNRRVWLIDTGDRPLDPEWIAANRDSIWATVLTWIDWGLKNWLSPGDELAIAAAARAEEANLSDPWEGAIAAVLERRPIDSDGGIPQKALIEQALQIRIEDFNRDVQMRVTRVVTGSAFLTHGGTVRWKQQRRRYGGGRALSGYVPVPLKERPAAEGLSDPTSPSDPTDRANVPTDLRPVGTAETPWLDRRLVNPFQPVPTFSLSRSKSNKEGVEGVEHGDGGAVITPDESVGTGWYGGQTPCAAADEVGTPARNGSERMERLEHSGPIRVGTGDPQNTPSDPIATAEMDLATLQPWQQSAITLKLANPTAAPAALINLIPQGELPRGANGATIKTFLAQPQIVELLAQHGEAA
ncbi:hypothetical protein KBY85_03100 [Cyanobium sp. BA5m-10]|uniref:VapE domain-containing protein n=1 Tax=Cyanobium sp. BA5m-10 TaxID=2823705 RepID=UPI0020CE3F9E|nr:VapE domain-containing protein [Cyanobium sp. BA5m-10]MCP9903129.1 hypothetical protein [Cyanobium sp. BA5m-10]